jgi:hypothetical protein
MGPQTVIFQLQLIEKSLIIIFIFDKQITLGVNLKQNVHKTFKEPKFKTSKAIVFLYNQMLKRIFKSI